MQLIKGLYTDCVEKDQPQGTYRFAKNMVDSNMLGSLENEDGFLQFEELTPYTLIGVIPVRNDFVVFSTDDTDSEIGLITRTGSTLNYTQIYNDPDLNFSTSAPIKGEYRKGATGGRVVAWIDDINSPRILDIDNLSDINNISDLDTFPDIQNPTLISPVINDTGGSLPTGTLIPITQYSSDEQPSTSWFVHDFNFVINDDSKSIAFNQNDGAEPGTISNKSVTFTLTGVDTNFSSITVGYISIIDGIVRAYKLPERTTSSTLSITITGNETATEVAIDEVLTPTAIYNNAKAITQLAGRLYLGNLTSPDLPDLQAAALDIKIDYTASLTSVISNTGTHKDVLPPTFMPGEVYAFYLGVELKKGGWAFYHIPGRAAVGTETQTVTDEGITYKRFQVENTTNAGGGYSNMGYWENSNETYPNDPSFVGSLAGDLRGLAVRHHRFPTAGKLADTYSGFSTFGVSALPVLGINVSNVNIPTEIQENISRWKIFFAKKDPQNSLVQGSDLLQFSTSPTDDPNIRWSSGGNWRTEFEESGTNREMPDVETDSIRGHSLDMLFNTASVTPTYANFFYKLRRKNLNESYSGFRSEGGTITIAGGYITDGQANESYVASMVVDYTVPTQTTRTNITPFIKRLDNFRYVPENALDDTVKTQSSEGVFAATISPGSSFSSLEFTRLHMAAANTTGPTEQFEEFDGTSDPDNGKEDTMYMQYFSLLSSVHNSFNSQDLVPTREYGQPTDTSLSSIYGGDSYICYMSYLSAGPRSTDADNIDVKRTTQGVRAWKAYVGYSRYNFNYRYQETGNLSTYYHGKVDVRTLYSVIIEDDPFPKTDIDIRSLIDTNSPVNQVMYTEDYNASNTYTVGVIKHPDVINQTEFPNTIVYSKVQNEESEEFSWSVFKAGDRVVIGSNRGDITNLQGFKNKQLIIHTQDSFFRTRTDIQVEAQEENVFFQSSNLFQLAPEEPVPNYAGTQHKFACVMTKLGYVFPDDKTGKYFLYDGEQLQEISSNGMRAFFRDFMGVNEDNPFTSNGYTSAYDERMNRLIVSKKNGDESWTLSYNPSKRTWTSFHDYTPDYMFNTADNNLYSIKDNIFYLNNPVPEASIQKGRYYGDTIYSSYVDAVFNPEPAENKQFAALEWVSESYPQGMIEGQYSTSYDYNTTCTHLTLRSADHCTGRISLSRYTELDSFYSTSIRNVTRTWYFNDIRDYVISPGFLFGFYQDFTIDPTKLNTNMEWYDQRKFTDKYVVCRFEYDNVVNNRFLLLETNMMYRYAR